MSVVSRVKIKTYCEYKDHSNFEDWVDGQHPRDYNLDMFMGKKFSGEASLNTGLFSSTQGVLSTVTLNHSSFSSGAVLIDAMPFFVFVKVLQGKIKLSVDKGARYAMQLRSGDVFASQIITTGADPYVFAKTLTDDYEPRLQIFYHL